MKKFLLLLGLVALIVSVEASRVAASPSDFGQGDVGQFILPADHNAVVSVDCQAVDLSFECITVNAIPDPGDNCVAPYDSAKGAKAKSPAITGALSNGDLTVNDFSLDRQCARLSIDNNRHNVNHSVISTSCGGIGY